MRRLILVLIPLLMLSCARVALADDSTIKAQLKTVDLQLSEKNEELAVLEQQKREKTEEISAVNEDIRLVAQDIYESEARLLQITAELDAAQAQEQASYEVFAKRLRAMYEQGDNSTMSMLLSADNIFDLIKRLGIIKEISDADRAMYDKSSENRELIAQRKQDEDTLRAELETKNTELNSALSNKNDEAGQLLAAIAAKKTEISGLESERKELNGKLNSVDYADALFAEAEKYLGMPYVFGGSTPATSFDCSGFVCYAVTHSGVRNLPRMTAQGIYNQCIKISKEEAKKGDIIFFQGTYNAGETVTHVGFYAGNGRMLHCGNPIQYTSINSPYWVSHFYAYGRLK